MWFSKNKKDNITAKISVDTTYHAVKISPSQNACDPVKWVSSKLFLKTELTRLPLESCDRIDKCLCKFQHFDDRRQNEDRRNDSVVLQNVYAGVENRKMRVDRRQNVSMA